MFHTHILSFFGAAMSCGAICFVMFVCRYLFVAACGLCLYVRIIFWQILCYNGESIQVDGVRSPFYGRARCARVSV